MKMINPIQKTIHVITLVTTILLMISCSNNPKTEDSKEMAEEKNETSFDNQSQEMDAEFLVDAAEINLEEIQLAKLAQQKGNSMEIKDLGKMMETAHTKSMKELSALAISKRISIPSSLTDDSQDAYKTLNEKSGDDFDKAYSDLMVGAHKDAIDIYEDASTECNDIDIKNWAAASLPVLKTHLEHSIESQKKFATMYIKNNN